MAGRHASDGQTLGRLAVPFRDQIADHRHEGTRRADGRHSFEPHPEAPAEVSRLCVEVVEDLHVVRDETDRHHHHPIPAGGVEDTDPVADVGFEPRLAGSATPALVDEFPIAHAGLGCHHPTRFPQLGDIPARISHRDRDAVGREQHGRPLPLVGGKGRQAADEIVRHRADESRMIEEHAELVDPGGPVSQRGTGSLKVLAVLTAA